MKLAGATYMDIHKAGGGSNHTAHTIATSLMASQRHRIHG